MLQEVVCKPSQSDLRAGLKSMASFNLFARLLAPVRHIASLKPSIVRVEFSVLLSYFKELEEVTFRCYVSPAEVLTIYIFN